MLLKLLESRRARVVAGWAVSASVVVHLTGVGGTWLGQRAGGDGIGAPEGQISVRYLLPPDHLEQPKGERIQWVAPGTGTTGFQLAEGAGAAVTPDPGNAPIPQAKRPEPQEVGDVADQMRLYNAEDTDSAATRDPTSDGPHYPEALRAKGVQGEVLVEFAVDTAGRADPATFAVVQTTDPAFAEAVREALPRMKFTPAVASGRHVRQLVRLPMKFKLVLDEKQTI